MDDILTSLFNLALYPFTSETFFVTLPCLLAYVSASFSLIWRIIRGDF